MLKYLLAAVLAVFALPANALTYLEINASGPASGFYQTLGGPIVPFDGYATGTAIIPLDDGFGCFTGIQCGVSGSTLIIIVPELKNYSEMRLTFDHALTGIPTSADGFVSGVLLGRVSIPHLPGVNASGSGSVDTLSMVVREGSAAARAQVTIFGAVPEPSTWAMLISGFALAGAALRRRNYSVTFAG